MDTLLDDITAGKLGGYTIQKISINKVKLNPANPRVIKDDAFKRLVKSVQDCPNLFEARPLLCSNRTGELIVLGGNMRLRVARELGYKIVPVIVMEGLTEHQEQEIAIKDNGKFGEWDFDILKSTWMDLPLEEWGVDLPEDWLSEALKKDIDAEPQIDRAEELRKKWGVEVGQLWGLGAYTICPQCGKRHDL